MTNNAVPTIAQPDEWVVWIDLDDTLWDFRQNSMHALAEAYTHFGLNRFWSTVDEWRHDYHIVNDRLWTQLAAGEIDQPYLRRQRFFEPFTAAGMDVDEAERLTVEADRYYLERLGKLPHLVPGARPLLQRLKTRGFRIGILSNGFTEVQYNKIKSAGIGDLIDVVVLSDEIMINKPDVRLFRYAEDKAGVSADRSIMIGDNGDTDIAGALNAGWALAVWFNPDNRQPGPALKAAAKPAAPLITVDSLDRIEL